MTDIVEQLNEACSGHPAATIPWPHRLLHNAADEIKRLRDRYEGPPAADGQDNVWPLYGYAPGMYQFKCSQCGEMKMGDKRSTTCLECAVRRLRLSLSEARAAGYREAYEVRMKKFRSGCACHMNDSDEIVSMCQHHEALISEARATGRREGMEWTARYHDVLAAQHAAAHAHVESDHHMMMERTHRRHAAAIRVAMEKAE